MATNNFSIIIPLYNKKNYIGKTLDSILNQSYSNFELIIIDDGSTDGSIDVVKKINNPKIKLICKSNEGVAITRNLGLLYSKYEYIIFYDADDIMHSQYLETINELITEFPECNAYATAYTIKSKTKEYTIQLKHHAKAHIIQDYCLESYINKIPIFTICNTCFKKSIFRKIGLFEANIKYGEDLDLLLRTAVNTPIAYSSRILYIYVQDSENNAHFNKKSKLNEFTNYSKWYKYNYFCKRSIYLYTSYILIRHFIMFISQRQLKLAVSLLWQSIPSLLNPSCLISIIKVCSRIINDKIHKK